MRTPSDEAPPDGTSMTGQYIICRKTHANDERLHRSSTRQTLTDTALVTMKGDFKLEWRVLGSGAGGHRTPAPALHYMYPVVSAEEFAVTAWGLSPRPPAVTLSSLGPLTWLERDGGRKRIGPFLV